MSVGHPVKTEIALNVTRTRITVLAFNLTIIALMLSIMNARSSVSHHYETAHLTSSVALFVGFCLTIIGILWLLYSQNTDTLGMSRPWPFFLGSITMYLALSQTVTAFMHEYLLKMKSAIENTRHSGDPALIRLDALGEVTMLMMFLLGGCIWILVTYVAPFFAGLRSHVPKDRRWIFAAYYIGLQSPIYWIYAKAWHLVYSSPDQPISMFKLFALQFIQPLLWFR